MSQRVPALALSLLALIALWLWMRDQSWMASASDTLPIALGFPLLAYFGRPWNFIPTTDPLPRVALVGGALLGAGVLLDGQFLCALGWTLALWGVLVRHLPREDHARILALLPLATLAFPWVTLEAQPLGWLYRLTGAMAVETLFHGAGVSVVRDGMALNFGKLVVSIDAPCSGLNLLQALLLAGYALAAERGALRSLKDALPLLPRLVVLTWVANTARILFLCIAAIQLGASRVKGNLHDLGGLLVVVALGYYFLPRGKPPHD